MIDMEDFNWKWYFIWKILIDLISIFISDRIVIISAQRSIICLLTF